MVKPNAQSLNPSSQIRTCCLVNSSFRKYSRAQYKTSARQNNAPQLRWLYPNRIGRNWMAGGQEVTTKMRVYLKVLLRNLKSWTVPRLRSRDDEYSWMWMRDSDNVSGLSSNVNWYLSAQLFCPTLLEGKSGKLNLAYSWDRRGTIKYVHLMNSAIISESSWA